MKKNFIIAAILFVTVTAGASAKVFEGVAKGLEKVAICVIEANCSQDISTATEKVNELVANGTITPHRAAKLIRKNEVVIRLFENGSISSEEAGLLMTEEASQENAN